MQRLLTAVFVQSMTGGDQQIIYTMTILLLLHNFSTIIMALKYKWHVLGRIYFHTPTHPPAHTYTHTYTWRKK